MNFERKESTNDNVVRCQPRTHFYLHSNSIMTPMSSTSEPIESGAKRRKNDSGMATTSIDHIESGNDVTHPPATAAEEYHGSNDDLLLAKIVATWKDNEAEAALSTTVAILSTQIDKLIKEGIAAYHDAESTHNELAHLQQDMKHKDDEIASLRAAEEKNTKAISVSTFTLYSSLFWCCRLLHRLRCSLSL